MKPARQNERGSVHSGISRQNLSSTRRPSPQLHCMHNVTAAAAARTQSTAPLHHFSALIPLQESTIGIGACTVLVHVTHSLTSFVPTFNKSIRKLITTPIIPPPSAPSVRPRGDAFAGSYRGAADGSDVSPAIKSFNSTVRQLAPAVETMFGTVVIDAMFQFTRGLFSYRIVSYRNDPLHALRCHHVRGADRGWRWVYRPPS